MFMQPVPLQLPQAGVHAQCCAPYKSVCISTLQSIWQLHLITVASVQEVALFEVARTLLYTPPIPSLWD